MIWMLRHIGVQLWISCLVAVPVSFYFLTRLNLLFPGVNPFAVVVVLFILTTSLLGFFMDKAARKRISDLIKEAQTWERSGIFQKAEKKYIQALRLYDTFLLWPFTTQKTALKLSQAIAGHQLTSGSVHPNLKLGTAVYLKMNPKDRAMAGFWLNQIAGASIVTSVDQEVLSILAQTYSNDKIMSESIKKIFQALRRNDYIAQKLYQEGDDGLSPLHMDDAEIQRSVSLDGIEQETVLNPQPDNYFQEKRTGKPFEHGKYLFAGICRILSFIRSASATIWGGLKAIFETAFKSIVYVKAHERVRFYMKAAVLALVCGGLIFFMISTLTHNLKTKADDKKQITIEEAEPKPFTIQVAAYLKPAHAQRYVDILKKQQVDAMIKKVDGGGKTWFVVRVSKFRDKKSAAEYGQMLKQKGLIEDFFVNNL